MLMLFVPIINHMGPEINKFIFYFFSKRIVVLEFCIGRAKDIVENFLFLL